MIFEKLIIFWGELCRIILLFFIIFFLDDNITYEVVKKEVQKKIINYLYQNNEITISEYEVLISKCDEKILKLQEQLENDKEKYSYPMKVDIRI